MGTWSRGAPLLPLASAADPGPDRWSPEPASSVGTGSDAARTARRPTVKARPGQHAQPPGFDPDDAKIAPRPAVNVPPGQHAQPPGPAPDDTKTARGPAEPADPRPRSGGNLPDSQAARAGKSRPGRKTPPGEPANHQGDLVAVVSPAAAEPANHHGESGPAGQRDLVPETRPQAQSQRGPALPRQEPSWPTVIATTIRLWWERRGRRWRWAGAAALAVVVVVAAGLAVALSRPGSTAPSQHRAGGKEAPSQVRAGSGANPVLTAQAARSAAAAWIDQQVSRGTIVSCDPVMCSALVAHGFPAPNLVSLRPSALDPLASEMIAATAVLRSQFGSRLTSVYAPITVASFGAGSAKVDVRVVAPDGSPAYLRQFRADLAARKAYGAQMLHNSKIVVAPPARHQLASGMVDSRLLATISTAAHRGNRLRIVSFGIAAPGATSGVPVRSAVIASTVSGAKASSAVLDKLRRFWLGQQAPYLPASTQIVPDASGQRALRIQFAAPSQLGLLSAGNPVVRTPR
jgi:hypothetical protein